MRGFCAFLSGVFQAQREGIHAKLFGHFIQHAFNAVRTNRRPWRAIGRNLGTVGHHVKAQRMHIRDVIGRESAARRATNGRARQRAGLQVESALRGDDGAILLGTNLDGAEGTGSGASCAHHFFARHHHLHRAARFLRQQQCHRFQIDNRLAAKAAADFRRNGADIALRQAGQIGTHRADHELALA